MLKKHSIISFFLILLCIWEQQADERENKKLPIKIALERNLFHQALLGKIDSTSKLIQIWSNESFITNNQKVLFQKIKNKLNKKRVSNNHYLPQSYAAASMLFALLDSEQIVAIPQGVRKITQLYPPELTNKISLTTNRYRSEAIALKKPKKAFVSTYSLPQTLNTLKNQGIELIQLPNPVNIQAIFQAIRVVGSECDRTIRAELLTCFMQCCMHALDKQLPQSIPSKILYLKKQRHWATPSLKTITGQLLKKIGAMEIKGSEEWQTVISREKLIHLNPDCIIIEEEPGQNLKELLFKDKSLQNVPAIKNQQLYCVDAATQQDVSQFFLLAYYDLVMALNAHHRYIHTTHR